MLETDFFEKVYISVYVCSCECVLMCRGAYAHVYRLKKSILDVAVLFFSIASLIELAITDLTKLAGQQDPGILLALPP